MRILVVGSTGFIGRNVSRVLTAQGYEVIESLSKVKNGSKQRIDLTRADEVEQAIKELKPEVIINCAGVIGANANFDDNVRITQNLINATVLAGLHLNRFVICGSASEYGNVEPRNWPVKESTPLRGDSPYARSKVKEEHAARDLALKHNIDLVVARIFNPIGPDMPSKFLIPNLLSQIQSGEDDVIKVTVSRLDSLRDYIDVDDAAQAISCLATQEHKHIAYNVGSGIASSTDEVLKLILDECNISENIKIEERSSEPEVPVASQADTSLLRDEFLWQPHKTLRLSIKEIMENYNGKR